MKKFMFRIFTAVIFFSVLSACGMKQRMQQAESNYSVNYGGYLANQSDCFKQNKHSVEFIPEGATAPVKMELSAGDCDNVKEPEHGGEHVATVEAAYVQAGGQIAAAGISGLVSYEVSKDNNRTRVDVAELQNEREAAENAVLVQAIGSRDNQTQAISALTVSVTEQSATLLDLVASLTEEEETDEGE